jgi:hypothetical protein
MRNIEDDEPVDIEVLHEGFNNGKLENAAASGRDLNAAESELQNESPIHGAEPSISERQIDIIADGATGDEQVDITKRKAEGEGGGTSLAEETAAGEAPRVITDHQDQKKESLTELERLDEEIEKMYPYMWGVAQFLAGR